MVVFGWFKQAGCLDQLFELPCHARALVLETKPWNVVPYFFFVSASLAGRRAAALPSPCICI